MSSTSYRMKVSGYETITVLAVTSLASLFGFGDSKPVNRSEKELVRWSCLWCVLSMNYSALQFNKQNISQTAKTLTLTSYSTTP